MIKESFVAEYLSMKTLGIILFLLNLNIVVKCENGEHITTHSDESINRAKRILLKDPDRLWTNGVIPYDFDASMDDASIREVLTAMSVYEQYTPIRFKHKTNVSFDDLGHRSFATFKSKRLCFSSVGREDSPGQDISCCKRRTCIHEIGHLLGFKHEISHPDRHKWVRINWHTFSPYTYEPFLHINNLDSYHLSLYDLTSFMHYEPWIYNTGPRFSILFNELEVNKRLFYMFKELCVVYKCREFPQCHNVELYCHNEGYISVVKNKCSCICLPGFDSTKQCSEVLKEAPNSELHPKGPYSLLRNGNQCPDGMTAATLAVNIGNKGQDLDICQNNDEVALTPDEDDGWPKGTYCFLAVDSCPKNPSIKQSILFYEIDLSMSNIKFCCLETDIPRNPINFHITKEPFSLVMYNEKSCQQIAGMHVEERTIVFNSSSIEMADGPYTESNKTAGTTSIFACDYTPVYINCGGIRMINKSNSPLEITMVNSGASSIDCTVLIKGPEEAGALILNVKEFTDVRKVGDRCVDSVEVKHVRMGQPGIRYCGEPIKHSIRSVYNNMTIRLQTGIDSTARFRAEVSWVSASDWCFNPSDGGLSYDGGINYTRAFQPCLPWEEAAQCPNNPTTGSTPFPTLEGNACRNPDDSFRPWCYTEIVPSYPRATVVTCKRDFCDVCQIEKAYDQVDDCDPNNCKGDPGLDMQRCADTCDTHKSEDTNKKASDIQCISPGLISSGSPMTGERKDIYGVGDKVTYRCQRNGHFTIERICLTSGKWSVANTACSECPSGFSYNRGKCYKFVGKWLTYRDAADECKTLGAKLTSITSKEENNFVNKLRPLGTPYIWLGGRWRTYPTAGIRWDDGQNERFQAKWRKNPRLKAALNHNVHINMYAFDAKWEVNRKHKQLPFVCKMDSLEDPDCMDVVDNCPDLLDSNGTQACKSSLKIRNFCRKSCGLCSAEEPGTKNE